jgi:hypothetical protein
MSSLGGHRKLNKTIVVSARLYGSMNSSVRVLGFHCHLFKFWTRFCHLSNLLILMPERRRRRLVNESQYQQYLIKSHIAGDVTPSNYTFRHASRHSTFALIISIPCGSSNWKVTPCSFAQEKSVTTEAFDINANLSTQVDHPPHLALHAAPIMATSDLILATTNRKLH